MSLKISRREFILSAVASVVSAGLGWWARGRFKTQPAPTSTATAENPNIKVLANLLRKKFDYLILDEADLSAFAHDFQTKAGKKTLDLQKTDPEKFEEMLGRQFLMSTDFFWNGANEALPVKYTAYYDPYKGCTSPFARFG